MSLLASGAFVVATVSGASACSFLEKVSGDQCEADGDCAARGFGASTCVNNVCARASGSSDADADVDADAAPDAGTPWDCLGHYVAPATPAGNLTLSFPFWNAVNDAPIPGIIVRTCAKLDVDCENPIGNDVTTDAMGFFSQTVPGGFDGFVKLDWSLSYPTIAYINPPLTSSAPLSDTDLVTTDEFNEVAAVAGNGMDIDPTKGHLFIGTVDCHGNDGADVHLSLSQMATNTVAAYVIDDFPTSDATATDSSGSYVAINVPTGPLIVTATLQTTGQPIGTASGAIAAGQFTYLYLVPSP